MVVESTVDPGGRPSRGSAPSEYTRMPSSALQTQDPLPVIASSWASRHSAVSGPSACESALNRSVSSTIS